MNKAIKVIIVDDHQLVVAGFEAILKSKENIEVISTFNDGEPLMRYLLQESALLPDLILMDIGMPKLGGIEATHRIKKEFPDIKILIITIPQTPRKVRDALDAKADGYILKLTDSKHLSMVIDIIMDGEEFFDAKFIKVIIDKYPDSHNPYTQKRIWTYRELETIKYIASGLISKQISEKLHISINTVKRHRQNILGKGREIGLETMFAIIKHCQAQDLLD